jgi:PAS domain S-box-containing protein
LGSDIFAVIHEDDQEVVKERLCSITLQNPVVYSDDRIITSQKGVRWVHWSNRGAFDDQGNLLEIQASGMDITDRILLEDELRKSEARFRGIIEDQVEMIKRYTLDGQITFANRAFCDFLNTTSEALIGSDNFAPIHPADQPALMERLRSITLQNPVVFNEDRTMTPILGVRWARWSNRGIFDEQGNMTEIQVTGMDITDRKLLEDQLHQTNRALRAISECNEVLVRATDESYLMEEVTRIIVQSGGYRMSWVGFVQQDPQQSVVPVAYNGYDEGYVRAIKVNVADTTTISTMADCIRSLKSVVLGDIERLEGDPSWKSEALQRGYRSALVLPLFYDSEVMGALEIFSGAVNAFDEKETGLLNELAGDLSYGIHTLRVRARRQEAEISLMRVNLELTDAYEATLVGWSNALDLREHETAGHSLRVVDMTVKLAEALGFAGEELVHVRRGSLLHDIGKMGIPDNILLKPGPLTPEEWMVMRQHPTYALHLLENIEYLKPALDIPYCHHEKWDGTGYPRGLKQEEIPFVARLFSVVDVYDALISNRPYRAAWTLEAALAYVKQNQGMHFDPQVVEAFLKTQ